MYKLENSSYGIGTWIELKIRKDSSIQDILSLTTNAINNGDYLKKGLIFTPILLILILIFLLIKLKTKIFFKNSNSP